MVPLDINAISGIAGSISIACWIVVFSPQIIENFRKSSADGLSIRFVIIWLVGDIFNIVGAVLQNVLPTMIIVAVYYTLADIVLLAQCFYYRGFTFTDKVENNQAVETQPDEESPLLSRTEDESRPPFTTRGSFTPPGTRRGSGFRERLDSHGTRLSPAVPMHGKRDEEALKARSPIQKRSIIQAVFFNLTAIIVVFIAGTIGWYLSVMRSDAHKGHHAHHDKTIHNSAPTFNIFGQICGYLCAVLYLGSRIPQLLLNYRRKSTEGVAMLFFIFACLGNLMYVISIFAYDPVCDRPKHCASGEAASIYWTYIGVNVSWILGSLGTLFLDAGVFVQYFKYRSDSCAVE